MSYIHEPSIGGMKILHEASHVDAIGLRHRWLVRPTTSYMMYVLRLVYRGVWLGCTIYLHAAAYVSSKASGFLNPLRTT